jgi:transcription termination factor Rho
MNLAELKRQPMSALMELARERGIENRTNLRRTELLLALAKNALEHGEGVDVRGVLERHEQGFGFLRSPDHGYLAGMDDAYVLPSQIRKLGLRHGDLVTGGVRGPKPTEAYFTLNRIDAVGGAPAEEAGVRLHFDSLTPVTPRALLSFEHDGKAAGARLVDLLCPIGAGHRCLVVSPGRAPRTALLKELAAQAAGKNPELTVVLVLLETRPEELTETRRASGVEVVGTTFEDDPGRHEQAAELALERAKRLVERGKDVLLLVDSITRLVRAENKQQGWDAASIQKAKRFFGAGRAADEGGSLTIIATAVVEGKADEAFADELRVAANAEIQLDRRLAEKRVGPAVDVRRTRSQGEALQAEFAAGRVELLRRLLEPMQPQEALEFLLDKLRRTGSNQELLETMNQ